MKIREMYNCVRPMCFDTKYDHCRYSTKGSCFVIRHRQELFAITAYHAIDGCSLDNLVIPHHAGSDYMLPMSKVLSPRIENTRIDTSNSDFAVIPIPEEGIDKSKFDESSVYDLSRDRDYLASEELNLIVAGYPAEINETVYDIRKLKHQRAVYTAAGQGQSFEEGLEKLKFDSSTGLTSFDGLSGGVVFETATHANDQIMGRLSGMLLMANSESKNGHYLSIDVITDYIEHNT